MKNLLPIAIAVAAAGVAGQATSAPVQKTKPATFADVQKILKPCTGCHTGARAPKGVDLSSYAKIVKGGEQGPIINAKEVKTSVLLKSLRHEKGAAAMPPGPAPMPAASIAVIESWIKAGAKEK